MEAPPEPEDGEEDTRERPDDPHHYRNYPPLPAVESLRDILDKFRDLTWIPKKNNDNEGEIITLRQDRSTHRPNMVC